MRRRDLICWTAALAAAGVGIVGASPALAQPAAADLNISPKRIVFSPDMRTAVVYVFNRGGLPATYTVQLTDRVMTPDGQVRAVSEPDVKVGAADYVAKLPSAQPLLTYTPRRVTLKPGESQVIRLRADRPADAKAGEYHTHLTVTTLPPETAGETAEEAAAAEPGSLTAKLNTLFSISIAVIVRVGAPDVQGGVDKVAYAVRPAAGEAPATAVLSMDLLRKGANSLYGDVEVRAAGAARNSTPLGAIRGVGVYTEIDRRSVDIPLSKIPARGERLEITLKDDDTKPGVVLASTVFTVP